MLRFLSCGESHGPTLMTILEGFPAGLPIDIDAVNEEMWRRQQGYGRGNRQKIEKDTAELVGGVRHGITTGAPIGILIRNRDFENWLYVMSPKAIDTSGVEAVEQLEKKKIERFRPGHADLAGTLKFRHNDIRDVLERASARETAARVAVGAICKQLLQHFGITIASHVRQVGPVKANIEKAMTAGEVERAAMASEMFCLDPQATEAMKDLIKELWQEGDSLGGVIEVVADGLPVGLGSYTQWDRRLDGQLAQALMSIQAMKAVEIGDGVANAGRPGSEVHDAIFPSSGKSSALPFRRETNHAGGIEGGMTNGDQLVVRAFMKPIPTMRKGLDSVNWPHFQSDKAHYERSDVCAISAASVVCKAMVCLVLANALVDKFAGDSVADMDAAIKEYRSYCQSPGGWGQQQLARTANAKGALTQGINADKEPEGNEDAVGEF